MRSNSTARIALVLAVLIAAGCAKPRPATPVSPAPTPLQQLRIDLDTLLDRPGHQRGTWGVVVQSLARDERLFERNPQTLLVPASTMKLVSVAVAAEAMGWDFRYETQLVATGPVVNGSLDGDLVIVGSGDPSVLGRPQAASLAPWIDALRARGITRVNGRVIGNDDAQEEPRPGFGWSWEDLGYTYGSIPGALNLAENTVEVTVSPAHVEGLPAVVELPAHARDLPIVNLTRTASAGTAENVWPEWRAGMATLSLNGEIAMSDKPAVVSMSVGNPTAWFARVLRNEILAAGIDVTGPAVDGDESPINARRSTILYVHRSPSLAEMAKPLIKDSINLYAEAMLRMATGPAGPRTADAGLDAVRARLQSWGIPQDGIQIVDGSGLSRRNVIAPETLMTILRRFYDASGASPFMQAQAIAGRDGTLRNRMKGTPAEGNAIGKTGSLSNVRTLAGYVTTANGEPLAFAIMANNFEGPASGVSTTIDRIVARLASHSSQSATESRGNLH
jgi:serine-type D-Ala-D-Ala carboxypeptidase/endopeptidase (penicillin-binding protein 4)